MVTIARGRRASKRRDSDTIRYVNATAASRPTTAAPLQTLRWIVRPSAMLEDCHRRYGDMFTLQIAQRGHLGLPRPPGRGQAGLHGRPARAARRRGQRHPAAAARPQLGAAARRRRAHAPAQADAAALPRRAHARLRADDARGRRRRRSSAGRRAAVRGPPGDAAHHARGDHAHGLRRAGRRAGARACATRSAARSTGARDPRRMAMLAMLGPQRVARSRPVPARARAGRRADLRGDPRAPRARPTSRSATTSSRCCCRPATRTAAR